jgi:hypothetical protein
MNTSAIMLEWLRLDANDNNNYPLNLMGIRFLLHNGKRKTCFVFVVDKYDDLWVQYVQPVDTWYIIDAYTKRSTVNHWIDAPSVTMYTQTPSYIVCFKYDLKRVRMHSKRENGEILGT